MVSYKFFFQYLALGFVTVEHLPFSDLITSILPCHANSQHVLLLYIHKSSFLVSPNEYFNIFNSASLSSKLSLTPTSQQVRLPSDNPNPSL